MQSISISPRSAGPTVSLTDSAVGKVTELLEREGDPSLVLRLGVRPGGCSGFSYEMFFDAETGDDDHIEDYGPVKVAVDPQSLELVSGAQIDYRDGLQGAGFHIENPNVSRSCGCGKSFS
jgi:iron-sulfur cluster assembly protein/iron-sulfur cluster insertion protein